MNEDFEWSSAGCALVKLGHAKKAAANSDARALMEDEPELTPSGALVKLGNATKAAANQLRRARAHGG